MGGSGLAGCLLRLIRLYFCLGLLSVSALAAPPPGKLLWSDEFYGALGTRPDPSKWAYDLGANGWGNKELENYTNKLENAFLDGEGHLVIRAIKGADGGFSSARMKTQGHFSFTYGRVEARMKLPRGQGMWPAFWMLGSDIPKVGWPACGEVDVMENLGSEPTLVHGTIHGPGYSGKRGISVQYVLPGAPSLADDFHLYAADWMPGRIEFSIDSHVYSTVTPASLPPGTKWVYDHPFFLILNLAVGGAWPGNPDASTAFPQDLTVDYIRVYELPSRRASRK
jgi:beta-glucanase (GH16 family)